MSWTNGTKDAASWTNKSLDSSAWATQSQTKEIQLLTKEDGFYILLETGDRIVLESTALPAWSNQTQH